MLCLLNKRFIRFFLLLSVFTLNVFTLSISAQDSTRDSDQDDVKPVRKIHRKGFEFGLSMGTYFANNYTASLYNGMGFDANGNPNTTFLNSAMYEKIVNEWGGGPANEYGGSPGSGGTTYPDRLAPLLGVQTGTWSFDSTDMPGKMHYNIAFEIGVQTRYFVNDKNAIILNVDAAQLTIGGAFTIGEYSTVTHSTTPDTLEMQTFAIAGQEERLIFQPGWQHIFGDDDQFNFFIEGGPIFTMAKFQMNDIIINGTVIDLRTYYSPITNYVTQQARNLTGVGIGAFAGFGLNLQANSKYALQLVYNPSFEKIALGPNPPFTMQNSIQLRVCYKVK